MSALIRSLWLVAVNRPIDGERFDRHDMWALTRPYWTHTIFTTAEACGCRKRFGLWNTIYCADHVFGPRIKCAERAS